MKLFLQGPRQTGKSTILRTQLLPYAANTGGFIVQRLFENNQPCGFRACLLQGSLPPLELDYTPSMDSVFLYKGQLAEGVLEKTVQDALSACSSPSCNFILLDEIGGAELLSPAFMEPLQKILSIPKPCIGVIKSEENLTHTASRLGLPQEIFAKRDTLQQLLEEDGSVLAVSKTNLPATKQQVNLFLSRYQQG